MSVVDAALARRAAAILRAGGLVAFPTETVYGLGAAADDPRAVAAIFAAKGRPADHPLIVHVADAAAASSWTAGIPPPALELMRRFWPGPLTLVLARAARAHDGLTGGQDSIGLRCPSHPWPQALLAELGRLGSDPAAAIAAPSANSFGRISPTDAAHVRADLGEKPGGVVDLVIDGGPCPVGIESTIVDCTGDVPRVLRPGSITRAMLAEVLGALPALAGPRDPGPRASGTLERHYAPRKPLELLAGHALCARINELRNVPLAILAPAAALLDAPAQVVLRLVAEPAPERYARRLYEHLHRMDESAAQRLLISLPPDSEDWEAIHDRLRRAAAGTIDD